MLKPIGRQSLSEAVFGQLKTAILSGEMAAGELLPAERELCETLGVSRPALREAIARLAHAGLLVVKHGGKTRVADWRRRAGLDLLPHLVAEHPDPELLRGALELRAALAPDVARKCAERSPERGEVLTAIVLEMEGDDDLVALRRHNVRFWSELIEGSQNLAYQLAYNSLTNAVDHREESMAMVLATELTNRQGFSAIAAAVTRGDGAAAAAAATAHIALLFSPSCA